MSRRGYGARAIVVPIRISIICRQVFDLLNVAKAALDQLRNHRIPGWKVIVQVNEMISQLISR